MVYELRVYHALPGRLPDLLKRFETVTVRLFEKHGIRQVGFWTVAVGESSNDLIYILQWESLADREKRFPAFAADPEWIEARRRSEEKGPLVASVANTIMTPTVFSALR
jgi:NIPSNAP protein